MIAIGNFFFRFRDALFPIVFVVLAIVFRPVFPMENRAADYAADALGLAVALVGQALRVAVIGLAYVRRGGKNRRVYADSLVQEGLFAHSRNPLYVGNLLVLLGVMIVHGSPLFLLGGTMFYCFAYCAIVAAEERFLEDKFGDAYRAYCQRVPRFIPVLRGISDTLRGMAFDWRRVVRKEYGSTFTWITCALALLVWEDWRNLGPGPARVKAAIVLPIFLVVLTAYVIARIMKKTKRLGHD